MANANWSNPQLTSTYTDFVSEVKNRDEDLALQFDGTTSTNIPTNTIRWDSSAGRWKKWNGTSWAELTSTYALTGLSTTGAASIGTTLGVTGAITGSSTVTGTALIPSGSSVPVNGIYLPSANSVAIATNSSQRLAIDSSGNITIPGTLAVTGAITGSSTITSAAGSATAAGIQVGTGTTYKPGIYSPGTDQLAISTGGSGRLFVDASGNVAVSGRVGIGTTVPQATVEITGAAECMRIQSTTAGANYITHKHNSSGDIAYIGAAGGAALGSGANTDYAIRANQGALLFGTNGNNERARIDSSGRLLVGTSTARTINASFAANGTQLQVEGTTYQSSSLSLVNNQNVADGPYLICGKSRGTAINSSTLVSSGDSLGAFWFCGGDGTDLKRSTVIEAVVDDTPGANSMPGRLVFSTTASGSASPQERFRIASDGSFSSVVPGGSTLYPRFGCRAWVNYNGGTPGIRANGNVSSVTKNGTGDYTVNFTTAMPDANYSMTFGLSNNDNLYLHTCTRQNNSTTSVQVVTKQSNLSGSGLFVDYSTVCVAIFR